MCLCLNIIDPVIYIYIYKHGKASKKYEYNKRINKGTHMLTGT